MQHLADGVLAQLTLILTILPLAGCGLVALVLPWGESMIRRVALTNVVFTLLLSLVLVWAFVHAEDAAADPLSGKPRPEASSWPLLGDPADADDKSSSGITVRFAVGVDGVNLWFVVLTTALTAAAVVVSSECAVEKPVVYYSLLLFLEGALIAAFTARDVMVFCLCLELSLLPMLVLTGWWGGEQRGSALRGWIPCAFVGSMLVMAALITLAVTTVHSGRAADAGGQPTTMLIDDLARYTELMLAERDLESVNPNIIQLRAWVYFILLSGLALQMGVVPFHNASRGLFSQAPLAVNLIWFGAGLKIGCCAIVRFMLVLLPLGSWVAADDVVIAAVAGSLFAGFAMWSRPTVEDRLGFCTAQQMGLCVAGLFSLNAIGIAGGLLLAVGHGVGLSLFAVSRHQRLFGTTFLGSRRVLSWLGCLSLSPVPGLATLPGTALVVAGVFLGHAQQPHPVLALALLTSVVAASWAMLSGLYRELAAADVHVLLERTRDQRRTQSIRSSLVASLLLLASLGLGLAPNLALRPMRSTVRGLLERNMQAVRQGVTRGDLRGSRPIARPAQ